MLHHRNVVVVAKLSLLLFSLIGCSRSNPLDRQAVSGSVVFDSKPLEAGSVQFCPERAQGGFFGVALVVNGKYEIPREKGLPPGTYVVRISAASREDDPKGPPTPPGLAKAAKELIPAKYNAMSDLKREVKSSGENVFDFTLDSKPGK